MTAIAHPQIALPPPHLPLRPFSVDEYHKMIEIGVLSEDDPVELLEGWIVFKLPHNPLHDGTISVVNAVLARQLPTGWHVRVQSVITTDDSEPEPDLVVARGDEKSYLTTHPHPHDLALVIEVADSSLAKDRSEKARVYARAKIDVYWIINLVDRQVEVYSQPSGPSGMPAYLSHIDLKSGEMLTFSVDGELHQIAVADLLP